MKKTTTAKTKKGTTSTKTKKPVRSVCISRKDGELLSLEEVISLHVWAAAEGYQINGEVK